MNDAVWIFLGPSLAPPRLPRGTPARVEGPARRGDIWRALRDRPRAIALIDGFFESQPSVWHRELLDALAEGVPVLGASSMGALRACELAPFGMEGVGQVYRWVADGSVRDDSEVALLHADAEVGYRPLTVPHVTVRYAAERAAAAGAIGRAAAQALVLSSGRIFYQERTWPAVLDAVPWADVTRERWSRWFARSFVDVKALDAARCIAAAAASRPRMAKGRLPDVWRRRAELAARATATPTGVSGGSAAPGGRRAELEHPGGLGPPGAQTGQLVLLVAALLRARGLRADPSVVDALLSEESPGRALAGVAGRRRVGPARVRPGRARTASALDRYVAEAVALAELGLRWPAQCVGGGPLPGEAGKLGALIDARPANARRPGRRSG